MKREIRHLPDPVLRTACDPVRTITSGVRSLVTDLMDTVNEPDRAGLAANQIGVGLRVFAYHIEDEIGYVINPELVTTSGEQTGPEGCLSVPGHMHELTRPDYAQVTGIDLDGRPTTVSGHGLMARCLLHELGHLDGTLFIDRLPGHVRREIMRSFH